MSDCVKPKCPESTKVCPSVCQPGFNCTLSVIDSLCQCPLASCVKVTFDTNDGDSNAGNNKKSSKGSIVGPVVGGLAGVLAVAAVIFFVLRRRRKNRQRMQLRRETMMSSTDDSLESYSKRWTSGAGDRSSQRDVIQIAYIPSMISESSIQLPERSTQGGTRSPFVISLIDDSIPQNKHDSVASILDEAVVMGVTTKATPQVMKLQTIKQTNNELIQRSNSLHTSNSIKRTNSQRHLASVKLNAKGGYSRNRRQQNNPSPLGGDGGRSDNDDEDESDKDERSKSGRRPSSTLSDNNPFLSNAEKAKGASGFQPVVATTSATSSSSSSSRNPFLSPMESGEISLSLATGTTTVASSKSIPDLQDSHELYSPFDPEMMMHSTRLTPWANNNNNDGGGGGASRESTFSTASDARSSTRGDGEEIMIFWGGTHSNRSSKASDM
ncbi:hypothetical protein BG004_006361 [Podila humilis]|nr:hypothetical protein BG004_006361 [Podila humilis]